ncbi:S8 family serine peptidase [candidate division WOR-3 bacterium]|nr:S8 family serine peptidase [candidate division WOR-3 bacterium]
MLKLTSILLLLFPLYIQSADYWVFFRDKDIDRRGGVESVMIEAQNHLSPRSLWRRTIRGSGVTLDDVPVSPYYMSEVEAVGVDIIGTSKWLNSAVIRTDDSNLLESIKDLSYVVYVDKVNVMESDLDETQVFKSFDGDLIYGPSEFQLSFLGIKQCHDEGYRGEGVIVSIFDSGFNRTHEALDRFSQSDSMRIVDEWDFVNGNRSTAQGDPQDTINYPDPLGEFRHGTRMFGLIAGDKSGMLIGAAKNADFCLYKTEWYDGNNLDVVHEEHWWVLAAERADSAGADIISSSLSYKVFRDSLDWSYNSMNGQTTYASRAAYQAARAGIVVVTAMSNITWLNSAIQPDLDTCIKTPADADSILSLGGTDSSGNHYMRLSSSNNTWYASACGPTFDGRRKPEVSASWWALTLEPNSGDSGYSYAGGTSSATAVTAGGVALLLQAHPSWKLSDVINALKSTASRNQNPNDTTGWGVANIYAALHSQTPEVEPVTDNTIQILYPNPFKPSDASSLTIEYILLDRTYASFYVFTLDGTMVWSHEIGVIDDGRHTFSWNGKNRDGDFVASGLYYLVLETGYGKDIKRIAVVR